MSMLTNLFLRRKTAGGTTLSKTDADESDSRKIQAAD
jgi:hypothetical protein